MPMAGDVGPAEWEWEWECAKTLETFEAEDGRRTCRFDWLRIDDVK